MTVRPHTFEHERYEKLCALATAGVLTAAESEDLFTHLNQCAECSKHFAEYQSLASEAMPQMVELHRTTSKADSFNESHALERLLQSASEAEAYRPAPAFLLSRYFSPPVWKGLIAASLLAGVSLGSYKRGESRHAGSVEATSSVASQQAKMVQEFQLLRVRLEDARQREDKLQSLATRRAVDLDHALEDVKAARARYDSLSASAAAAEASSASTLKTITEEQDASTALVQQADLRAKNAQDELNALQSQRKQDLTRIASLEGQVGGLTVALNEQDNRTKDDEQYLASDKDIRDLIGARNLYIADIMDVREDGSSRKPFGRVFYTKTKSLIFYAYDLDKQPGVKKASTFQVWGRTGPDDRKPLNLGVLYLDSETNRRWALRVDNPQQLARLDAVFVTIEQHEQTDKPTGKPFLYASLRREPNHP